MSLKHWAYDFDMNGTISCSIFITACAADIFAGKSGRRKQPSSTNARIRRFFLVHTKWNFYRRITPVAERYIETARTFGVTDDKKGLEIFLPDQTVASAQSALSRLSLGRYEQVIGVVPTARHFTKRWPADRFVELGIQLSSRRHVKILIFGGKEDQEYCNDLAQMINSRSGSAAAESFAGKFSLLETAAAFDCCHVVVSNDSGLMHLAAARQTEHCRHFRFDRSGIWIFSVWDRFGRCRE